MLPFHSPGLVPAYLLEEKLRVLAAEIQRQRLDGRVLPDQRGGQRSFELEGELGEQACRGERVDSMSVEALACAGLAAVPWRTGMLQIRCHPGEGQRSGCGRGASGAPPVTAALQLLRAHNSVSTVRNTAGTPPPAWRQRWLSHGGAAPRFEPRWLAQAATTAAELVITAREAQTPDCSDRHSRSCIGSDGTPFKVTSLGSLEKGMPEECLFPPCCPAK